jgi:hypothetical protein
MLNGCLKIKIWQTLPLLLPLLLLLLPPLR